MKTIKQQILGTERVIKLAELKRKAFLLSFTLTDETAWHWIADAVIRARRFPNPLSTILECTLKSLTEKCGTMLEHPHDTATILYIAAHDNRPICKDTLMMLASRFGYKERTMIKCVSGSVYRFYAQRMTLVSHTIPRYSMN